MPDPDSTTPPAATARRRSPFTAAARRTGVALAGGLIVVVGLLLVPLPGPGWAVVFLGTSVLGREFPWAARLTESLRQRARAVLRRLHGAARRRRGEGASPGSSMRP